MFVIKGIAASPGVTIGPAVLLPTADFAVANQYVDAAEVKAEIAKFNRALEKTLSDLDESEKKLRQTLGGEYASLMSMHKMILQDPMLKDAAISKIKNEHMSAQAAIFHTHKAVPQVDILLDLLQGGLILPPLVRVAGLPHKGPGLGVELLQGRQVPDVAPTNQKIGSTVHVHSTVFKLSTISIFFNLKCAATLTMRENRAVMAAAST